MEITFENYEEQAALWPRSGKRIQGTFDGAGIVVYQAFSPEIVDFATANGYFGGAFSLSRMSWIKPNFLSDFRRKCR